jgi:hypothetical protein
LECPPGRTGPQKQPGRHHSACPHQTPGCSKRPVNSRRLLASLLFMWSIGAIAPTGALAFLNTHAGPVGRHFQYTPNGRAGRSQIQRIPKESNSKLHGTIVAHSIHTIQNCEQRRNELSGTLICYGHVLRCTKALKKVIFRNYFCVGWIVGLLVLS